MGARKLAELLLKVWAVTVLIDALAGAPSLLWLLRPLHVMGPEASLDAAMRGSSVINFVMHAAAGIAVLVWADRIVGLFEDDETSIALSATSHELLAVGFAILGAYMVVLGLGNVAGPAYVYWNLPELGETTTARYMWSVHGDTMVRAAVQLVAGLVLIVGRERIANGVARLRRFPAPPDGECDTDNGGR